MSILSLVILLLAAAVEGGKISISIVSGDPSSLPKALLTNAYLGYLYSPYSGDMIELKINGQQVIPWMRISDQQAILRTIINLNLSSPPGGPHTCIDSYHLSEEDMMITRLILVTDRNPCSESALADHSFRGNVLVIGYGGGVSDHTLSTLARPNTNYLRV